MRRPNSNEALNNIPPTTEAGSKEKQGVWDPKPELTIYKPPHLMPTPESRVAPRHVPCT